MVEIDIALPAYNCAAWLDDLMQSILQQDADNWRIVTRDDASTDGTAACLASWKQRLGDRMLIVESAPRQNLGFVENYNAVLAATSAKWIMLADSDDVWRPGKMALTQQAMLAAETTHGAQTPIAVFSDAEVVDERLQPVTESYWSWSRANVASCGVFHRLVVDNPAISSTMMLNRALITLALPTTGAVCLDWWLMMAAAAFGRVVRRDEKTVCYRRHSANDSLDPYASTTKNMVQRLAEPGSAKDKLRYLLERIAGQAGAFEKRYHDRLSPSDLEALNAAICLPSAGAIEGRWSVARHGLWFGSFPKNVALMFFL